jgi:hypothetical protein
MLGHAGQGAGHQGLGLGRGADRRQRPGAALPGLRVAAATGLIGLQGNAPEQPVQRRGQLVHHLNARHPQGHRHPGEQAVAHTKVAALLVQTVAVILHQRGDHGQYLAHRQHRHQGDQREQHRHHQPQLVEPGDAGVAQ